MNVPTAPRTAPGPRGDTLLGSTLDFAHDPLEYCTYVARTYGDVARFRVGPSDWYLISHPDLIWEVMTAQADVFLKPKLARRLWKPFLGNGLLTTEGAEWRKHATMMKPTMHRSRLDGYAGVMTGACHRLVDTWVEGETRDIHADMTGLTLEIVARCLFDADVTGDAGAVGEAMEVLQAVMVEHIHLPVPLPAWWPSERNRKKVDALKTIRGIVARLIAERRASGKDHGDLLSMLLQTRSEEGQGFTDQEVFDQAMTLFFAGHETSANGLTWAWYLMSRHPEVVARLRAEIDAVCPDRDITLSDLRALPYLDNVVHECLRILPPVWVFMKEPIRDTELGGFRIPKGVPVIISPYIAHHDPRFWDRHETFDPDRFDKAKRAEHKRGSWIPFSGGARVCFGKSFAMLELRLVLATILRRMEPGVPADHWPKKKAELSMHPEGGMPWVVKAR